MCSFPSCEGCVNGSCIRSRSYWLAYTASQAQASDCAAYLGSLAEPYRRLTTHTLILRPKERLRPYQRHISPTARYEWVEMSVLLTYLSTTRISQPASLNKGKAGRQRAETSVDRLIWIFVAWKLVLLVVACLSPGPGYDTSTQILLDRHHNGSPMWFARAVEYVVLRLTRWDAIYFTTNAERGYVYEQQWAFSWLLSNITSLVARGVLPKRCQQQTTG